MTFARICVIGASVAVAGSLTARWLDAPSWTAWLIAFGCGLVGLFLMAREVLASAPRIGDDPEEHEDA